MARPYDRVQFRGVVLNERTKRMVLWAERKCPPLRLLQGSYNGTRVAASAGTHAEGGALDAATGHLTRRERRRTVRRLKRAGFAAWYRPDMSPPHIHAIAKGDDELSPEAAAQVRAFNKRRNGLANNGWDFTFRPLGGRVWSWKKNKPIRRAAS